METLWCYGKSVEDACEQGRAWSSSVSSVHSRPDESNALNGSRGEPENPTLVELSLHRLLQNLTPHLRHLLTVNCHQGKDAA
ncbi:hypothetical protein DPEC_G00103240 [Dallia pectoralis]|uniref:Uncharacterized protein n=1 Tax=Dallia pectoralis TaxID=75939 RepID=A0ACC2GXS8_DALPE|nr:hypothetical protein DPEC_G00103240 [Dallia pectoralis]